MSLEEFEKQIAEAQTPEELVAIGAQVKKAYRHLVVAASVRLAELKADEDPPKAGEWPDTPEVAK